MPILQTPHFFFSWQMPIVVCPVDLLCPIAVTHGRTCSLVSTVGVLGRGEEYSRRNYPKSMSLCPPPPSVLEEFH